MNKYFSILFLSILVTAGIFSGCEQKKQDKAAIKVPLNPNIEHVVAPYPAPVPVPTPGVSSIRGKVTLGGPAPEAVKLDTNADPVCSGVGAKQLLSEEVVVNPDNTLRNAFAYLVEGPSTEDSFPVPTEPVVLDQKGCHYSPHVIGVRVDQPVQIVNSDPTLHNVHGQFQNSPEFNLGMPIQGMKSTKKFSAPEVMARMKCDVHPWMSAYVGVVKHPYFAVTGDGGAFEFKNLKPGSYKLQIWHEKYGTQNIAVEVRNGVSEIYANYATQ